MAPSHSGDPSAPGLVSHTEHHRDGSVCATGQFLDGELHGYWEWYRTDGTRKRSGHFDRGRRVGEWTTYDRGGVVYKVTTVQD
ncbi:hypothetical protein [Isoptericola sp. AK164]|uniref:toxin-antitoxin system YwqK family antitoxin n=1 Tax=Isoptericola sp. AK164 TaxID=3024246 RepID=UPI0024188AAE|nr:hypothetical protein [Isoptericola sp. AK164]